MNDHCQIELPKATAGDTEPLEVQWLKQGLPRDLSGRAISGAMQDMITKETRSIKGDMDLFDAEHGRFYWRYHEDDRGHEGRYWVQFRASDGNGSVWVTRKAVFHVERNIADEHEGEASP